MALLRNSGELAFKPFKYYIPMTKQEKIVKIEKEIERVIDLANRAGTYRFRALIAYATTLNKKLRDLKNKI